MMMNSNPVPSEQDDFYELADVSFDDIRSDIRNSIENCVDDVLDYARGDLGIEEGGHTVPVLHMKIEGLIREMSEQMTKLVIIERRLELPDEFTMCEGRETWHWALCNFDIYGIEAIKSRKDMLKLLLILESCSENFENVHHYGSGCGGYGEFCGICGCWESDTEVVETLFEHFLIYDELDDCLETAFDEATIYAGVGDSDELTKEVLEDIRESFSWYIGHLSQRFLSEPAVRDCRC